MQVAATPMPTWRALAVSSAIGTPVVVSTYIIINNNFFSNKKNSSSQAREGCAMVYHNNFGSIFFTSGSAKIRQIHQTNLVRSINQFLQTHQFH
jgi:hypothetical protein